jgi:hypothetical protein
MSTFNSAPRTRHPKSLLRMQCLHVVEDILRWGGINRRPALHDVTNNNPSRLIGRLRFNFSFLCLDRETTSNISFPLKHGAGVHNISRIIKCKRANFDLQAQFLTFIYLHLVCLNWKCIALNHMLKLKSVPCIAFYSTNLHCLYIAACTKSLVH